MKFTAATIVSILSTAVAFSPNSLVAKSMTRNSAGANAVTNRNVNGLVRSMSAEVEVANVNIGQRKKTKEVSSHQHIMCHINTSINTTRAYSLTHLFYSLVNQERLQLASKGLQVHVIGLSIHHASVEVREKLAIKEQDWNEASNEICSTGTVSEAAVLSTCNRFEVYYAAPNAREATARVTEYLAKRGNLPVSVLRKNVFMLSGDDAVWHAMRVSGGLDSLVVGEGQILSQVRQCHLHSIEEDGCGGKVLSRMLNTAVAAGKRVRSETAISKGSVSISSAAVELSEMMSQRDLNLPFKEARLAVVGAGKMTRLLITHLASRGLEKITIVNRSLGRPQELQEQFPDVEIEIKLMDDLWDVVGRSDIVFTATSCEDYVIDANLMKENGLAGGRPLMLVDISVPRNVGTDCNTVRGPCILYLEWLTLHLC